MGDLPGILQRVDHFTALGVDAVWLSPIFPSPMADFGYDVADYTDVDPLFGALHDLDLLIGALHERGIKLLLDLVPNHTSDRHPWFVESRSSRASPKRDWYIWRDPRQEGGPPNGWVSAFGGSAWEWDEPSGQYYFHAFLKEQPDLDWTNPEVRAAFAGILRSWFDRGVDGFRIDVIWLLGKGPELEVAQAVPAAMPGSGPAAPASAPRVDHGGGDQPAVHEIIAEMRPVANGYEDRVLIGEIYLPQERLVLYYGTADEGLHLPFNFQLLLLPWNAGTIAEAVDRYEALLPAHGWPNWVLGNHDRPRVASRIGEAQARVAAMMLLTLRGTPTIYYGDEIGMIDATIAHDQERDPQGIREPGRSRDPQRTPMRWDGSPKGDFTTGDPWLPMGMSVEATNVAAQRDDPRSMFTLHRRLLTMRRQEPALAIGAYQSLGIEGSVMAYRRSHARDAFLIVLNLGHAPGRVPRAARGLTGQVVLTSGLDREGAPFDPAAPIDCDEALLVRLDGRAPG